jgi:hypothetical protein
MSPQEKMPSTAEPGGTRRVDSIEELWALIKFRLVAFNDPERIEREIEHIVETWHIHIDKSGLSCDELREKLRALVREGLDEDRVAYFERRKH